MDEALIETIRDNRILIMTQPIFIREFGNTYFSNLGEERAMHIQPIRTLLDQGITAVSYTHLTAMKRMRAGEGERLCNDLLNRVTTVESIAGKIDVRAPFVVEEYRTKLSERIESCLLYTSRCV